MELYTNDRSTLATTNRAEARPRGTTHARGQGRQPRAQACNSPGVVERSYPTHEVKGGSQEEQPHVQGAAAALCWSSHEEIPNIQVRR